MNLCTKPSLAKTSATSFNTRLPTKSKQKIRKPWPRFHYWLMVYSKLFLCIKITPHLRRYFLYRKNITKGRKKHLSSFFEYKKNTAYRFLFAQSAHGQEINKTWEYRARSMGQSQSLPLYFPPLHPA